MIKLFFIFVTLMGSKAYSSNYSFSTSPGDYLFKDRTQKNVSDFDEYRTIELGIDLSSGVDCGRLDLKGTIKTSIDKVLDKDMFGNALENIIGGAPMLSICYFSPTWCSIAKHFRVNAQSMSQIRLDQCSLMDKYTDSRVEDYYAERQKCLHKELQNTNGNHEEAVSRCGGSGVFQKDLSNWAGNSHGAKSNTNRLIDSSAKWAGLDGPKFKRSIDLVKAFVGDTIINRGSISVEYGPRKMALSPRLYLTEIKKNTYDKVCGEVLPKLSSGNAFDVFDGSIDNEINEISINGERLLDRQSLYYLSLMPKNKRSIYCEKLSASIAMSKFSNQVGQSLQILTELANNPNLPPNRKKEIIQKRKMFKESVDFTISLEKETNDPVNLVLSKINSEGSLIEKASSASTLRSNASRNSFRSLKRSYFDCSEVADCTGQGR